MRFPSIATALHRAGATARRFPWTLAAALVATDAAMAAIAGPERPWQLRLLAIAVIGLSALTAVTTAAERAGASAARRHVLETLVAAGLAALFAASLAWPSNHATLRFAQLLVASHLLVAVLPYAQPGGTKGFWQFNRFLFERFLVASLYASVLWVGLAVALVALKQLLGVEIPSDTYGHLFVALTFLFHPWFLLSGVPRDYQRLEELDDYPIGIKIFTQFVLIPLVTVYLAILLLYIGRVALTRTWPSGWIGYLVSSVSVVGVLALLLVHPIRDRPDSKWVNAYGRWFFVALLAPLVTLLMAIGKRLGQYGVTEPRYFLLVLGLWGLGIAAFYALTASRNIKIIPMTLAGLALLTAVGPWGAYQVSLHSQLNRLSRILATDGMGRLGAITPPTRKGTGNDLREISAIMDYLYSNHGAGVLATVIGVPRDTVLKFATDSGGRGTVPEIVMRRIGLTYVEVGDRRDDNTFRLSVTGTAPIDVAGFDRFQSLSLWPHAFVRVNSDSIALTADSSLGSVVVKRRGETLMTLDILDALKRRGYPAQTVGSETHTLIAPIVVQGEGRGLGVRLTLTMVSGSRTGDRLKLTGITGYVLLRGH
jgi:hypothetical protein